MSKPIVNVTIISTDEKKKDVPALFDSGSFYTIVRQDCLPSPKAVLYYKKPRSFGTAKKLAKVEILGETSFVIVIGKKMVNTHALISSDLSREMIIGAETMQSWDISIKNKNGHTQISVGHDMRDPEITEVD